MLCHRFFALLQSKFTSNNKKVSFFWHVPKLLGFVFEIWKKKLWINTCTWRRKLYFVLENNSKHKPFALGPHKTNPTAFRYCSQIPRSKARLEHFHHRLPFSSQWCFVVRWTTKCVLKWKNNVQNEKHKKSRQNWFFFLLEHSTEYVCVAYIYKNKRKSIVSFDEYQKHS